MNPESSKGRLERVEDSAGHQVCQVDPENRWVIIEGKQRVTIVSFPENGKYDVKRDPPRMMS